MKMKHFIIYSVLLFLPLVMNAQEDNVSPATFEGYNRADKAMGDSAYSKGDYATAINIYEHIIANEGIAPELYYNLGNAYYKSNEIAKAILNYERALLLDPSDNDTRFNLELARAKTIDKVSDGFKLFLTQWVENVINLASMSTWAVIGVCTFILMLITLLLLFFGKSVALRKTAMSLSVLLLVLTIFSNIAAKHHYDLLNTRNMAIIMKPSVTAKSTPDNSGTSLFVIHEGRKVKVSDDTMKEWKEIELEDGTVGWVPTDALDII